MQMLHLKKGTPTYIFLMGVPGQSLALQTAERVGVRSEITKMALEFLSPESRRRHMDLEEIERMKEDLRHQNREAREEKSRYHALMQKLEREKDQAVNDAVKSAEKKIQSMIEQSRVEDVFRRHERLEQIKTELPEIVKPNSRVNPGLAKVETAEDFAKAFPPGSKVFATTIGRDGVVQGQPNAKGEVPVLSNSMRLMVPWTQLRSPQQASNPTSDVVRRIAGVRTPLDQDRTVDLRGLNMEEALRQLEDSLDTAVLNQESRIRVVHGHGTDTLKKGVRGYLSRSTYVKKWKAGTPESGGDGITWVELRD